MFGAEAVSNLLVMVKNAFSVPGAQKPEHIIYDTNYNTQCAMPTTCMDGTGYLYSTVHIMDRFQKRSYMEVVLSRELTRLCRATN